MVFLRSLTERRRGFAVGLKSETYVLIANLLVEKEKTQSPFPAVEAPAGHVPRLTAVPRRVLVVEDHLDSMRSLVFLLSDMGHKVDFAINGYAALQVAERLQPEFVLLDLGLPGVDGFFVCQRIKTMPALKDTRVIAITGYASEEYRSRSKAAGCELHLVKPVSPEVLEAILESPRP